MTVAHKITAAVAITLLVILGFAGYAWFTEHDARVRAELTEKSSDQDKALNAQQINTLQKRMDTRDADDAKQQSQTAELIKSVQTIAQIKAQLPQYITLPSAPQQITRQQAAAINAEKIPDAPQVQAGDFFVSQADAKAIFDKLALCSADDKSLSTCSADKSDLQGQLVAQKKETADEQAIAETWKKAAKGGSVWHRTLTAAKWIGIGAAVGYAAAEAKK
jgi:hypothetical protein